MLICFCSSTRRGSLHTDEKASTDKPSHTQGCIIYKYIDIRWDLYALLPLFACVTLFIQLDSSVYSLVVNVSFGLDEPCARLCSPQPLQAHRLCDGPGTVCLPSYMCVLGVFLLRTHYVCSRPAPCHKSWYKPKTEVIIPKIALQVVPCNVQCGCSRTCLQDGDPILRWTPTFSSTTRRLYSCKRKGVNINTSHWDMANIRPKYGPTNCQRNFYMWWTRWGPRSGTQMWHRRIRRPNYRHRQPHYRPSCELECESKSWTIPWLCFLVNELLVKCMETHREACSQLFRT